MNRAMVAAPCAAILCIAQALPVHAETASVQTYDDIMRLGADGWIELPETSLKDSSRQQLKELISKAAARMGEDQTAPLAEEYGRISRVIVMDEVQWKLAKEQEAYAQERYHRARNRARDSEEKLSRYSTGGNGRAEIMKPMRELAESSQQAFQYAMRDYLQAGARTQIRRRILEADRMRQQALMEAIPADVRDILRLQREFLPEDSTGKFSEAKQAAAVETEAAALARYSRAVDKARVSQELLARRSVQGENRLDKMSALKDRMESDQREYQLAARDYAQAKVRNAWLGAAGVPPAPQGTSTASEESAFFSETGSAMKAMEDAAQMRSGLQTWLRNAGYSDGNAAESQKTGAGKARDSARAELAAALSLYREALDKTEKSLGILRRNSWQEASAEGKLSLFRENAEHDLKELQYACWAYARAWMKLQWALRETGKGAPVAESGMPSVAEVVENFSKLRAEFLSRCFSPKYLDEEAAEEQLFSSQPVQDPLGKRFSLEGEVRLDSGHSSGEEGIGSRTRLRARLYPDYNFDNNWHLRGMLEYEHTLAGKKGSEDDKLKLSRYYLEGKLGALKTRLGVFGSNMAEGNIYDSKFKGVHLEAGSPVRYAVECGSMDASKRAYNVTASYKGDGYRAEAGYYHFSDVHGATRRIFMGNFRRPLGAFDFGLMLLYGRDAKAGSGGGYVLSFSRGQDESWKPGNIAYWLKYYRQPSATYISHTMNGMADLMSADASPDRGGFQGIGIGWNYTVNSNLFLALEYYRLRDLSTGVYSNTIWGALTGYFQDKTE